MQVPIAKPIIGEAEKGAVLDALSSGQLSQGPRVAAFERAFAAYHRVKHGVATSSGTTALTTALMGHEVGPGDEVIVPAFTFFATASSVLSVGATPVFADIDAATFCMSPSAAEGAITSRTRALLPVHLYGLPADMPAFERLCAKYGLVLLEDAAQAHGASIGSRKIGSWGTAAFSFYPTKNMTTTEGGMVLTNDDAIAERMRRVRHQGMSADYLHEIVGYNFRMTEPAAAIGLVQLPRLPEWQAKRSDNARYYDTHLTSVSVPRTPEGYSHAYNQYTVRVRPGVDRDAALARLNARGIGARVYYPRPVHKQPVIERLRGGPQPELPEAERAAGEVISIPVHPSLTEEERSYVATEVDAACGKER